MVKDLSLIPEPLRNENNCQVEYIEGFDYAYGYRPSMVAGAIFCALFGINVFWHLFQTIRFRRWTSILLVIGAITELIGWVGRTWSAACPYNENAFLIQITTLIIAPVFFSGALYVLLGHFIVHLGPGSSILTAKWYAIIFLVSDLVSLVLQAAGGGMASIASGNLEDPWPGTRIMIAGVGFQLAAMTIFLVLAVDFLRRQMRLPGGGRSMPRDQMLVLVALFVSAAAIYARNIFRAIELAQGWNGHLMEVEGYFIGLDGALMVLAVSVFIPFEPAKALRKVRGMKKSSVGKVERDPESGMS